MRPEQAAQLVGDALGRPPQDELEAAVVLEAWGGVPTSEGLRLAAEANAAIRRIPTPLRGADDKLELPEEKVRRAAAGVAVLIAIIAMAAWAVPLSETYGGANVANAWRIALPITLALQSWFTVRHASQRGLGSMPGHRVEYVHLSLTAIALVSLLPAPSGPLAALFVMTWSTGAVLVQRGWFVSFAMVNGAVAVALLAGVEPVLALGIAMAGMTIAAYVATLGYKQDLVVPGPNARASLVGVTGALLGVILVIDPSIEWNAAGYVPVLALIPALVGNVWASTYLSRLWSEIPQYLLEYSVSSDSTAVGRLAWRVVPRALYRFVGAAVPLSIVVLLIISRTGVPTDRIVLLLLGLATAMIASLGIVLLDVFGRQVWAFVATAAGCASALLLVMTGSYPFPGAALMLGALVTLALSANPIRLALNQPDRTLGSAMLLP